MKPPSAFKTGNSLIVVAWVAQTFPQLALLPIVIVGQNVQAAAADARAEATYNDAAAVLEEAKQIQAHPEAQNAEIVKILSTLTSPKAVWRVHTVDAKSPAPHTRNVRIASGRLMTP